MPGIIRDVPAGLFDAGLASLATLASGLAGVNQLGDVDRGVYAVFFAAFMLASVVPQGLVYSPAEVHAVRLPVGHRVSQARRSLLLGLGPSLLGCLAVLSAAWLSAGRTGSDVIVPLTVTAAIASVLSPAQDHLRRLLHIGRRSWAAAAISAVQLATAGAAFVVLHYWLGVAAPWIPFGMLVAANAASMTLALLLAGAGRVEHRFTLRQLAHSGRWLLLASVVPLSGLYVAANILTVLAGAEAMGFAEAARVAAQPVLVLGVGLSAVFGPRAMEAAAAADLAAARRANREFLAILASLGVVYIAVAGYAWSLNPMPTLVPAAYRVSGLVAVTAVAHLVTAAWAQLHSELLGGRRERKVALVAAVATPLYVIGAATAALTGAFARAIGQILGAVVRYRGYHLYRTQIYAGGATGTSEGGLAGPGSVGPGNGP